jgi:hypothetical protein
MQRNYLTSHAERAPALVAQRRTTPTWQMTWNYSADHLVSTLLRCVAQEQRSTTLAIQSSLEITTCADHRLALHDIVTGRNLEAQEAFVFRSVEAFILGMAQAQSRLRR